MWAPGLEFILATSSCSKNRERRASAYFASSPIDTFNTATTKVRKPWTEVNSAVSGILYIVRIDPTISNVATKFLSITNSGDLYVFQAKEITFRGMELQIITRVPRASTENQVSP